MSPAKELPGEGQPAPPIFRRWMWDVVCVALLLALGASVGLAHYRAGIGLGDEGFLAYGAERVAEGQAPNRDFVSLQPPLAFYTAAAAYKLLGTSVLSLRIFGLGLYLGVLLLVYGLARRLASPGVSLTAAAPSAVLGVPFFNFAPAPAWQGIAASLAAGLLLLHAAGRAAGRGRRLLALSAGIVSAASILLRHDQGLYAAVSILALAVVLRWSRATPPAPTFELPVRPWLCGMALVLALFGIWALARGVLPAMYRQLVVQPLTTYARTSSSPFPCFAPGQSLSAGAAVILFYTPPLVILAAAAWLAVRFARRRFALREAQLVFMTAWSALFYCQALTRSDNHHLLITLPPFFVLCAWCWSALGIRSAIGACVAAAAAGALVVVMPAFVPPRVDPAATVALPRAGVRAPEARGLENFIRTVQSLAPPDRPILALPYQPMFYFLAERRNPTRWNYLWPGDQTDADHRELVREMRADPPALVIITGERDLERYAPIVLEAVRQDYKRRVGEGPITFYLR